MCSLFIGFFLLPLHPLLSAFQAALLAIVFKSIPRMKLLFLNYLGDYSYSFQGSVGFIRITVTIFLLGVQNAVTEKNSPQEFSIIAAITVT